VRAVGEAYPLYGTITTRPAGQWARLHEGRHVLIDPSLMIGLDARVGDTISLGYQSFEIIGSLDQVPGDPGMAAAMAPRLFMLREVHGGHEAPHHGEPGRIRRVRQTLVRQP
jgi:putative ABC transport system permease protein